jgi:hypothetical protein
MMKVPAYILPVLFAMTALTGCKEPSPEPDQPYGKIKLNFHHFADGQALQYDTRNYVNQAGNEYMVNEIQYFISDVYLMREGNDYLIDGWKDIHYVDTDIETTWEWEVFDNISTGYYTGIRFTFGITETKNQSLMFTDPPESLMFWPEYLGGGYHYLKLNGKWLDTNGLERPYNFHLGIGQEYDAVSGEIIGFIQNYFEIIVPSSDFTILAGETTTLNLVMHIDRWFSSPHTYDHNEWGGDIMQKQEAMRIGCENGTNVFEVLNFGF